MECDICDTNHFLKQNKTNRKHGLIKRCERSEILSNFQTMWINGKGARFARHNLIWDIFKIFSNTLYVLGKMHPLYHETFFAQ